MDESQTTILRKEARLGDLHTYVCMRFQSTERRPVGRKSAAAAQSSGDESFLGTAASGVTV